MKTLGLLLLSAASVAAPFTATAQVSWGPAYSVVYDQTFDDPATTYHTVETRDLRPAPGVTSPDTYLYVFRWTGALWVLAGSDDDGGSENYASKVTNLYTGNRFRVLVVAYSPARRGTCDVVVNNVQKANDATFGGWRSTLGSGWQPGSWPWTAADTLTVVGDSSMEAVPPISDSLLYAFGGTGAQLHWDDDSHIARQATVTMNDVCVNDASTECTVIVAPWSLVYPGYAMLVKHSGLDADSDGDGVPLLVEQAFGSSDSSKDSDGDNINDYWEVFGVPHPSGMGGGDVGVELHALGSSPAKRDVFITWVHFASGPKLSNDESQWNKAAFTDDAAWSGYSINTHLLSGIPTTNKGHLGLSYCHFQKQNPSDWTHADELRSLYLNPLLKPISHFVAVGQRPGQGGNVGIYYNPLYESSPPGDGCLAATDVHGEAIYKELLSAVWATNGPPSRGKTLHEMGHNFDLHHGYGTVRKSVMNKDYVFDGFLGPDGVRRWSYSNGQNGPLCNPQDRTSCPDESVGCDCDEWERLKHPARLCGDNSCHPLEFGVCCTDCTSGNGCP
ncbi:MAG: hypothetical protein IT371_25645 [Deltaproteobacteria bacterium]|nr:hypothetical protein [Deltaproteobacteria bacterium]